MRNFLQLKSRTRAIPEPIWAQEPIVKVCCWVSPSQSLDTIHQGGRGHWGCRCRSQGRVLSSQASPNTFSFCVQVWKKCRRLHRYVSNCLWNQTVGGKWLFLPCCRLRSLFKLVLSYAMSYVFQVLFCAAQMLTSTSMFHCQCPCLFAPWFHQHVWDSCLTEHPSQGPRSYWPEGTWSTGDRGEWWLVMVDVASCVYKCNS